MIKKEKPLDILSRLTGTRKAFILDLKKERGRGIFKELVRNSEAVVESYRPDVMQSLGLGYEVLREINPKIVYAAVTGFGHREITESPYLNIPAFDLIIQAMGGVMSVTGPEGGPQVRVGPSIGDIFPGALVAFGIMVAVHKAKRTGEGMFLDVSMYDSMVYLLFREIAMYSFMGKIPAPMGNKVSMLAPYSDFEAKDGKVIIAVPTESTWEKFCKSIRREDLLHHPKLSSYLERYDNFNELLKPAIEEWTKKKTKKEIVDFLLNNGVPAAEINTIADIFECPHIAARKMLTEVEYPGVGKAKIPGVPIKFLGGEMEISVKRAPMLGEQTKEILSSILGYSEKEIEDLRREGII